MYVYVCVTDSYVIISSEFGSDSIPVLNLTSIERNNIRENIRSFLLICSFYLNERFDSEGFRSLPMCGSGRSNLFTQN